MNEVKPPCDEKRSRLRDLITFDPASKKEWFHRLIVVVLAALVFLPFIGSFGLWDPWETHYGEVARQITERNDWISTWWGSHWEDAKGSHEGNYFYSKPILMMWLMAMGISVFGISEIGIRIGIALISILALGLIYTMGTKVFSKRTGVIMTIIIGTSPIWFFLSRQAQTDMPFVGLMTIGMCFFMLGLFSKDRKLPADKFSYALSFGWIYLTILPQFTLILAGLSNWRGAENPIMERFAQSPMLSSVVGFISLGLSALLLFGGLWKFKDDPKNRLRSALAALALIALPYLALLIAILTSSEHLIKDLNGWYAWGPIQVGQYAIILGLGTYLTFARPNIERRRLYLYAFYIFVGLATLAKGLLGFMLPGAILFIYILTTRRWKVLKEVELLNGIAFFIAVTFPWYAAMLIRHGMAYWNRFFVHDHFKRLASGVHQIDTGSFEHFVKWLGYGLFPWSAFIPALFARVFGGEALREDEREQHATLMIVIWMVVAFTLFTLSSTKFHHYIFPAMPAIGILLALLIDDALNREFSRPWPLFLLAIPIMGMLAWDILSDPQIFKNLFTYKYDRKWKNAAWDADFRHSMFWILIPMFIGAILLLSKKTIPKRAGFLLTSLGGLALALFCLNSYMPNISNTWSQKGLWDYYYAHCTKLDTPAGKDPRKTYCKEPAVSYKLNWRGETYYSQNQVVPIRDDDDFTFFLKNLGEGTFYGIMEAGRFSGGFRRKLPQKYKDKSCIVYNENMKFVLAKAPCEQDDPERIENKKK